MTIVTYRDKGEPAGSKAQGDMIHTGLASASAASTASRQPSEASLTATFISIGQKERKTRVGGTENSTTDCDQLYYVNSGDGKDD